METAMKMLTQMKVGLVAGTVALALALPALAEGKEGKKKEDIKLADCPAAVQQTIKDNAGGGEVVEVEKSTKKDGTVVYEAEVKKADGTKVDIEVAADGKLIEAEAEDEGDHQDNDENANNGKDDDNDNDKDGE